MATIFIFEELDDATREYLLTVRSREGRGMPGVFIKQSNSLPTIGCILGPILILVTLGFTLTPDLVFNEPSGLALLQTAGILLGTWMILAAFRSWFSKKSRRIAGHWSYVDPLFLCEARAEQLSVTPMSSVTEVKCVHNMTNNVYQNTVVTITFEAGKPRKLTFKDQRRAEAIVQFSNFLTWSKGPEGFGSTPPPPAVLGALAKYVSKNDSLPLDENGAVNLGVLKLDVQEIPTEIQRVGSARPNVLIYGFLLIFAVGTYFAMKQVDVPARDEAFFKLVTTDPMQPIFLRQYLADDRNQLHRDEIFKRLGPFYDREIAQVKGNVRDAKIKEGMMQLLDSLKRAEQPVVFILVVEQTPPPGGESGKDERSKRLRDLFVRRAADTLTTVWDNSRPPSIDLMDPKPPTMGEQLIRFIEAPENTTPHLEIRYQFVPEPGAPNQFHMKAAVTIRDDVKGANSWKSDIFFIQSISAPLKDEDRDGWASQFSNDLGKALFGNVPPPAKPLGIPQIPRFELP